MILHADVLSGLDQLPPAAADCVVTSPPYWRLRQYAGVAPTQWADGQLVCLGAEADPDSFVRHLVQVFQGVRRAMADHACLFVNLGETYASDWPCSRVNKVGSGSLENGKREARASRLGGLQEGDRCGIPERFALAMQADGWVWRDTIMWVKRSPMPMSRSGWRWMKCRVKVANGKYAKYAPSNCVETNAPSTNFSADPDRLAKWSPCPGCPKCLPNNGWVLRKGRFATTNATEPIFMFVKGGEYFCDSEAASEPATYAASGRTSKARGEFNGKNMDPGKEAFRAIAATRLPRNYMLLSSEPTKEKHFAAFPSEIPRRLITMATSQGGYCSACGVPFAPMVESERVATRPGLDTKTIHKGFGDAAMLQGNRDPERHVARTNVLGYRACCTCNAPSRPGVVLDPFAGTGTTLRAAHQLGRDYIGIEASAHYLPIIEKNVLRPLPSRDKAKAKPRKQPQPHPRQSTLFAR